MLSMLCRRSLDHQGGVVQGIRDHVLQKIRRTSAMLEMTDFFEEKSMNHWIGLRENLQETHGFLPSNWLGFPVKIFPSSNSMNEES